MIDSPADPTLKKLARLITAREPASKIPESEWPALLDLALRHKVAGVLLYTLEQTGETIPKVVDNDLKKFGKGSALQIMLHESAMETIAESFDQAQLPAIWLKGSALAYTVYPEPWLRIKGDIDVLVPQDRHQEAYILLKEIGYDFRRKDNTLFATDDPIILSTSHHVQLSGGPGNAIIVELHHHLVGNHPDLLDRDGLAWFWEQTTIFQIGERPYMTLSPEAHLLYLCAHAELQHGEEEFTLQWFFDLHRLIGATPSLNWEQIIEQAGRLRWTVAVESGLGHCKTLFDTPLPADLSERLWEVRRDDERLNAVRRLQGEGTRWEKVSRLLAELSFRDKARVILRIVFPSGEYMREYYGKKEGAIWPYYLVRWVDQGRSVLKALRGRIRNRRS